MKKEDKNLNTFISKIEEEIANEEKDNNYIKSFYQSLYSNERTFYQTYNVETKEFDLGWIRTIESYFPSIDSITRNLKSTLRYEEEILPIEKVKKITKHSVVHLTANTQLINEVTEDGVVPKKALTDLSEIEYGIYENRFIMTLIKRLQRFISSRLEEMRKSKEGFRENHLVLNTNFNFNDKNYDIDINIKQKETYNQRKVLENNNIAIERAERLEYLVNRLQSSKFMIQMKDKKDIKPPVLKTSIIAKNPDYKNAYLLWLYLDRHTKLEYKLTTEQTKKRFTKEYNKLLDRNILFFTSSLISNDNKDDPLNIQGKPKYKEIKPKIIPVLPNEVEVDPKPFSMENDIISEYYLNKSKDLFKEHLDDILNTNNEKNINYKVSLKQALTDSLNITNSLYASLFEIDQDTDIFSRLIKEEDPLKALEEAYKKYDISKTIRQVKEKDFHDAINLEKKWIEYLKNKQKELINKENEEVEQRIKEQITKEKEKLVLIKEKQLLEYNKKRNKAIQDTKKKNDKELEKLKDELKKIRAKNKQREKEKVRKEKERLKRLNKLQEQKRLNKIKEDKHKLIKKQLKDKNLLLKAIEEEKNKNKI